MPIFQKILMPLLLIAALTAASSSADPPANSDRRSGSIASLSNGVSIKITGIGENPSTGSQWWLASGDLLNTPPYARMQNAPLSPSAGCVTREFSVEANGKVKGSDESATVSWEVINAASPNLQSNVDDQGGKQIPGVSARAVTLPDTPGGATLHASVAAGKWNTILTLGEGACAGWCYLPGGPKFLVVSQAFDVNGETHVFGVFDEISGFEFRLVVVDLDGKPCNASCVQSTGSGSTLVREYAVRLPMKSIRQWQLQSRSFNQWIEIRGISLHPGQKTNPMVVTSDDQPAP